MKPQRNPESQGPDSDCLRAADKVVAPPSKPAVSRHSQPPDAANSDRPSDFGGAADRSSAWLLAQREGWASRFKIGSSVGTGFSLRAFSVRLGRRYRLPAAWFGSRIFCFIPEDLGATNHLFRVTLTDLLKQGRAP